MQSISVIVPIFNEQENIPRLHEEIARALESLATDWEAIYVDDGSSDGSFELLAAIQRANPEHIRVIRLRRNFGQTAALAAGFDAAVGEIIIPLDGDLQNDPADIAKLVAKLDEGYDIVSGWRARRQDPFISRRLPSNIANSVISLITGVHLHDYGCTLKAYRHAIINELNLYGELHRFLPALGSWAGARVTEVAVNHRPRQFGKSKYGIDRILRVVLDLITVKFLLSYSTKPMQIFGRWGFLCIFFSIVAGIITLIEKLGPQHLSVNHNGWFFIASFLMIGGLQLICMGFIAEICVRTYYESQKKPIYTIREKLGGKQPQP